MNVTFFLGIGASIFTAAAAVPQLIKILREKKANDISITMLIILFIGFALWVGYGIQKKDWIIILSNAFSLIINLAIVIVSIKYKNK